MNNHLDFPCCLASQANLQFQPEVSNRSRIDIGWVCGCAAVLLAAAPVQAATVTAPYTQDFQSYAANASLADEAVGGTGTVNTNTWKTAISGGNVYYQNTLDGSGAKGLDSLQFSNLGPVLAPNTGFKVSVQILPVTSRTTGTNVTQGVRFLASTTNTVNDAYAVDLNIGTTNPGRMRLIEWTGSTAVVYPDSAQTGQPLVAFDILKAYQLDVVGMYDSLSRLLISATVTEVGTPANTVTHTFTTGAAGALSPDASPRTGNYFGFYTSFSGAVTEVTNFDNFSVTLVPEPSTLVLGVSGLICLLGARRRRFDP
ncbi:MAG: hypothetical protein NTW21_33850 [Verrucomicrobia bacterium]|nr:hypothetical protein [Verrucomicrobiota bacterium]